MPETQKDFNGHVVHHVVIFNLKDQRMVRASLSVIPRKGEIVFADRKAFRVDNIVYNLMGNDDAQIATTSLVVTPVDFDFDPMRTYEEFSHSKDHDVTLSEL